MTSSLLPPAFAFLRRDRRTVVDTAIVEVLPHLDPLPQSEALDLLIERSHPGTLARLVVGFRQLAPALQPLVRSRAASLSAGVRAAIASSSFESRVAAIDLIVECHAHELAYLLVDALRTPCGPTRERAANGLATLAEQIVDALESGSQRPEGAALEGQARYVGEALSAAIGCWDRHSQLKVLTAALWLGDRTEATIRQRISEPKTKLARALSRLFETAPGPRLAASALRCMRIEEVRSSVSAAISNTSSVRFLRAILRESWLLADPEIAKACRWIRYDTWAKIACQLIAEIDDEHVDGAVRFIGSIGGLPEQKVELLRLLLDMGDDVVRNAVVWQLVTDTSEPATKLLTVLASRPEDQTATIATRELRRRQRRSGTVTERPPRSAASDTNSPPAPFDRLWSTFGKFPDEELAQAIRDVRSHSVELLARWLQERLAEPNPLDRVRALRITEALDCLAPLAATIQQLIHDSDALVRSQAIALLPKMSGPASQRMLRSAMNDPDERVQANAIEALEQLDVPDRASCTKAKLTSPNSRVRANAIKSLLGMELKEAGEALLDMLDDESPAHRLSALWVIERLHLRAVLHRLEVLSEQDPSPKVRRRAARIRAGLIGRSATPAAEVLSRPPSHEPVGESR